MQFTGERPFNGEGLYSSRIRYSAVLPHVVGKNVLDFGCGIGYGSFFMSQHARSVIGCDASVEAIAEAGKLSAQNIQYTNSLDAIDMSAIDIVVAIESIEHIEKQDLEAVLKSFKGVDFVGTTPNGEFFPYHPERPQDRVGFHVWHYCYQELLDLFGRYYQYVDVSGCAWDKRHKAFTGYTIFASNKCGYDPLWLQTPRGSR